ncbi:MAG: hypothetical protein EOP48_00315 [Sphingobacteriales bacterium]|nr:MAG: hypothetical protein EOP48_00315 [Sphingobacteriales bacterium]
MSKNILEILSENYPEHSYELATIECGATIHGFFIYSTVEDILSRDWENIRNSIGVYFQSKLILEFEIWNIYLFFVTDFKISKELKHRIEHDTVSSRKIIICQHPARQDANFKHLVFSEHITNDNLKICDPEQNSTGFTRDTELESWLYEKPIDKRDKDEYLNQVLDNLEQSFSDEI